MKKEEQLEMFKKRCKKSGIKLTPQRLIIYERLINTTGHPTVETLYSQIKETFPTISQDTVHRTLVTFCDIGVANMVEGTGIPKRFEGNLDHHHHIHCAKCGKIFDFYHEEYDRMKVPNHVLEQFEVTWKNVHIEGICKSNCTPSDKVSPQI